MVNITKTDFFNSVRLNRFTQTLANEIELSAPLTFLNRTPMVNVFDDMDILSSYSGPIFMADLITDDAEAVVVEGGRLETTARISQIPNIKIGERVGQGMMRKLHQLHQGVELIGDAELITGWELNMAQKLITGVRFRQNQLCAAMMLDGVTYDKMGVKINAGFGTPAELKSTVSITWSAGNAATMKPISDLQYMAQTVAPSLGKNYNRVTMATTTFQLIINSTEFYERVRLFLRLPAADFSLNPNDVTNMSDMFERITGLKLELDDTTGRGRNSDGTSTSSRILPDNKVILSNTNDDNNPSAFDFANAIVDESIVSDMVDNAPFTGGPQVGPISYYVIPADLNPPALKAWAVAKGWPRKHDKYATAILTVF